MAHTQEGKSILDEGRGISPLLVLQARFQQNQMREKEEKLLRLYEEQQKRALKSVGSRSGGRSTSPGVSVGQGKVRHLFQSRRRIGNGHNGNLIPGRDKSYPLEPLTKYRTSQNVDSRLTFTTHSGTWRSLEPHRRSISLDRCVSDSRPGYSFYFAPKGLGRIQSPPFAEDLDSGRNFRVTDESLRRRATREEGDSFERRYNLRLTKSNPSADSFLSSKSPLQAMERNFRNFAARSVSGRTQAISSGQIPSRGARVEASVRPTVKETISSGISSGSVSSPVRKIRKATPAPLSVAPPPLFQKRLNRINGSDSGRENDSAVRNGGVRTRSAAGLPPPKPATTSATKSSLRSSPSKLTTSKTEGSLPSNLLDCRFCGRHFAADRVSKHEAICQKSTKSNRKPFDALQQRVRGTEVEKYIKKSSKTAREQVEEQNKPRNDWRKKHEEFIRNIRAAKEVSAHLKKGGKLSDLPPPPPSDYSDYIQCPHCFRKFNEAAAERHIPKCANIINNKTKPRPARASGTRNVSDGKPSQAASLTSRTRK